MQKDHALRMPRYPWQKIMPILLWLIIYIPSIHAHVKNYEHFIALSDIHFDPFVECKQSPCALIESLQNADAHDWHKIFKADAHQTYHRSKETGYALLHSTLTALQKISLIQQPDFSIISGDFLAHDYRTKYLLYSNDKQLLHYHEFIDKTYTYLTDEFNRALPAIAHYPVIGNNDAYLGDYYTDAHGAFFKAIGNIWQKHLRSENDKMAFKKSFSIQGNYAIDHGKDFKLIFLNSVVFSKHAKGHDIDTIADNAILWLEQELKEAEADKRRILIIMHIPPGIDVYASLAHSKKNTVTFWREAYTQAFIKLLEKYHASIEAILAGHTHMDFFQLLSVKDSQIIVASTPAISPQFGNNPAFKIYQLNTNTQSLEDYTTYYLPNSSVDSWTEEYHFNDIYQDDCNTCRLSAGMSRLARTGPLADRYIEFYNASRFDSTSIAGQWDPYYWCRTHTLDAKDYRQCLQN